MNIERIESAPAYMAGRSSATDYSLSLAERQGAAQLETVSVFLRACQRADANALAPWAPLCTDYEARAVDGRLPMRTQALHEVLSNSLDYAGGPAMAELMQLLLNVAHGANLAQAPEQARELLGRMASTWAKYNSAEVDA